MKFLSTALTALLILLDSQEEVGSQSLLVGSHDPKTSNAVWKQNRSKGFEVADASYNRSRQLLTNSTSRWVEVGLVRFFQKQDSDGTWKEMINLRWLGGVKTRAFSLSYNGKRVAILALVPSGTDSIVSVYERNSNYKSAL
eukprot:scaffold4973_cov135-Cylindrotheca_fusiformis.AAC.25